MFALESAMDEMAHALRMDPLAFRLANYAERDEQKDKPFASKGLRQCYSLAAEKFGWSRRDHTPGSMRDGRIMIGWGMATSTYPTNRRPCEARIRINPDDTVLVQSGVQDLGTGTYTIMAQCAADRLGVDITRVTALLGDSRLPPGPVSGGSATAASVIPAVEAAVDALRARLATLARSDPRFSSVAPSNIALNGFDVVAPGLRVPLREVMQRAGVTYLDAEGSSAPGDAYKAHSCHAFGAQFTELRIDPDFGTIRVSRMVSCFEAGRLLNARTGRSQLLGGIVFGIGMALQEETLIDRASGRIVNSNIADYHMPVNADVPELDVMTVDAPDLATGALGAKGLGELPMVGGRTRHRQRRIPCDWPARAPPAHPRRGCAGLKRQNPCFQTEAAASGQVCRIAALKTDLISSRTSVASKLSTTWSTPATRCWLEMSRMTSRMAALIAFACWISSRQ